MKNRKRLSAVLSFAFAFALLVPFVGPKAFAAETAAPTESSGAVFSSEEEWRAAIREQIAAELAAQGIESPVYFPGDPVPANDIGDYKTEVVATRDVVASGWIGNQPTHGVTFNTDAGGLIMCVASGGPTVSVSVSFGDPWGIATVSLELGAVTASTVGYAVPVPGWRAYKIWADHTYTTTRYVVYKYVWVDDFTGYQWQEYSGGVNSVLKHVSFEPRAV